MKILYHHRTQSKDGQRVHIDELIHALRARGCEVIVVEPSSNKQTEFGAETKSVSTVRALLPKFLYELLELAYSAIAFAKLRAAYLEHRPDVIYERHNLFLLAGVFIGKRYGIPCLLEVNSPLALERERHGGLSLKKIAYWTEQYVWRSATYVLPVTRVLAEYVTAAGVPEERIKVIPNGINPESFAHVPSSDDAKRSLGLTDYLVLGFTGFVRDWHGLDRVIDFVAKHGERRLCLFVVGDGPAREELEAQARRLGVADRVRFTGIVARDDVARQVAAFDVALQPAATHYASPLKLFEYMALARAVIAPAQPNLTEILTDGVDALLFDPAVPGSFEAALERIVSDEALRARLGAGAAGTLLQRGYTWDANAVRVLGLARPSAMGGVVNATM